MSDRTELNIHVKTSADEKALVAVRASIAAIEQQIQALGKAGLGADKLDALQQQVVGLKAYEEQLKSGTREVEKHELSHKAEHKAVKALQMAFPELGMAMHAAFLGPAAAIGVVIELFSHLAEVQKQELEISKAIQEQTASMLSDFASRNESVVNAAAATWDNYQRALGNAVKNPDPVGSQWAARKAIIDETNKAIDAYLDKAKAAALAGVDADNTLSPEQKEVRKAAIDKGYAHVGAANEGQRRQQELDAMRQEAEQRRYQQGILETDAQRKKTALDDASRKAAGVEGNRAKLPSALDEAIKKEADARERLNRIPAMLPKDMLTHPKEYAAMTTDPVGTVKKLEEELKKATEEVERIRREQKSFVGVDTKRDVSSKQSAFDDASKAAIENNRKRQEIEDKLELERRKDEASQPFKNAAAAQDEQRRQSELQTKVQHERERNGGDDGPALKSALAPAAQGHAAVRDVITTFSSETLQVQKEIVSKMTAITSEMSNLASTVRNLKMRGDNGGMR